MARWLARSRNSGSKQSQSTRITWSASEGDTPSAVAPAGTLDAVDAVDAVPAVARMEEMSNPTSAPAEPLRKARRVLVTLATVGWIDGFPSLFA